MRNPDTWNEFCNRFDEICEECFPNHAELVGRFSDPRSLDGSPNIMFYGAEGFPIHMLLDFMFRRMYGSFTRNQCQISSDLEYYQTQWFLEFDFHHPNFMKQSTECFELIKQMIQGPTVHGGRHVIVLKNVDGALLIAKQMFRVLLERYSKNAIFICTTHNISKLEPPLKSRFTLVRIALPSKEEIMSMVRKLGLSIEERYVSQNVYKTLLTLDLIKTVSSDQIESLCSFHYPPISELSSSSTMEAVRTMSNKICQTNVPFRNIILDLLSLLKDDQAKMSFVEDAASMEHMLACTNGGRQVLYVENLIHRALFGMKTKS